MRGQCGNEGDEGVQGEGGKEEERSRLGLVDGGGRSKALRWTTYFVDVLITSAPIIILWLFLVRPHYYCSAPNYMHSDFSISESAPTIFNEI